MDGGSRVWDWRQGAGSYSLQGPRFRFNKVNTPKALCTTPYLDSAVRSMRFQVC